MLLRFLTLATVSLTYLTVQAVSSTETKSERLSATSAFTHEHIADLPSLNQIAMLGKNQATQRAKPPLPKSFKVAVLTAKAHRKLLKKANSKKIIKKKKRFVRLAYMPSSYNPAKLKKSNLHLKKQKTKSKAKPKKTVTLNKKKRKLSALKRRKIRRSRAIKPKYSLGARVASKKVAKYKKKRAAKRRRARRVRYKPVNYHAALSGGVY